MPVLKQSEKYEYQIELKWIVQLSLDGKFFPFKKHSE